MESEFDPVAFELGFRQLDADNDGLISYEDIVKVAQQSVEANK